MSIPEVDELELEIDPDSDVKVPDESQMLGEVNEAFEDDSELNRQRADSIVTIVLELGLGRERNQSFLAESGYQFASDGMRSVNFLGDTMDALVRNRNESLLETRPRAGSTTSCRVRAESLLSLEMFPVRQRSDTRMSVATFATVRSDDMFEIANDINDTIQQESAETGRVKLDVLGAYVKSLGVVLTPLFLFFQLLSEGSLMGSRIWLADWTAKNETTPETLNMYFLAYCGISFGQALFGFFAYFCLAAGSVSASRKLHKNMMTNVMRGPMSFFDTTPLGRIINRFSKDMFMIDDIIPKNMLDFSKMFIKVLVTICAISLATPLFLAVIVPLAIFYVFLQRVFVSTSRQLKRIEAVSCSPIFNYFFETISGSSTIRAYSLQEHFIRENNYRIDENHVAYYPNVVANKWMSLRMEFIGNCVILFAALFAVISRGKIESGFVGLSMVYALQITFTLYWMVQKASELEANIVSVERVKEYSDIATEAEWILPDSRPPDNWPSEGKVQITGFDFRYREGLPLVLKDINCTIEPGEKIGIVGRTGAGKSSLTVALFRILESAGGKIVIDDIDISKIGLQDLRSKLTIIPQDPVLFSGTLRLNLDPFGHSTDEELWKVLEVSNLHSFVSSVEGGLYHPVVEGGENLSVGQRQLVCLARALLRKNKILVLDEATAAVDLETDEFIQNTIRTEFSDRTVLTIAHRLNTIMDYTRIMVLDKGFIVEFDTPTNLLAQQGIFYSMAHEAGLA